MCSKSLFVIDAVRFKTVGLQGESDAVVMGEEH